MAAAREAGLLVVADGKRGDVPVTAAAYAQALVGETATPWGAVPGLGADAFTANPLLGADALEPLVEAAEAAGAGMFVLVRTSNPGAADLLDLEAGGGPLHERIAALVAERPTGSRAAPASSGMGAVVGATEPRFLAPVAGADATPIFLVPGVGAQERSRARPRPAFADYPRRCSSPPRARSPVPMTRAPRRRACGTKPGRRVPGADTITRRGQ